MAWDLISGTGREGIGMVYSGMRPDQVLEGRGLEWCTVAWDLISGTGGEGIGMVYSGMGPDCRECVHLVPECTCTGNETEHFQ